MKISGIYQIQSKKKPKRIYIGSSCNINSRWKGHLRALRKNRHDSKKLQNHYNKYGEPDLMFSILAGCDENDLIKLEQYYFDSHNLYFNICPVAGSSKGRTAWNKGKKASKEWRENISNALKGKIVSEETRKRLSEANKGVPFTVQRRINLSNAQVNYHKMKRKNAV